MRQTADRLARFGTPTVIAPTLGALLAIGVLGHRPRLTRLALTGVEGMVITTVLVQGSKFAVGRTRPYADPDLDGSDFAPFSGSASFPSGHTAAAFALATTLGDGIGGPWARIGLYALATGTAWARMAQEQHWLSDVTGGAALGILAAKLAEGRRRLFGVRLPLLAPGPHALRIGWAGVPWN